MKTDDLIRALAADAVPTRALRALPLAVAAGLSVSVLAFALTLGPRDDIAQAVTSVRFLFKPILMLALAGTAWVVLTRLIAPGVSAQPWLLVLIPAALALALAAELTELPRTAWRAALFGDNWRDCLTLIPLLSLPPVVALLLALRRGAPTRPGLAGAVAGLVAGGAGAALYAINCTDDSPLFVAVWYGLAIALVSVLSAWVGQRLLRW